MQTGDAWLRVGALPGCKTVVRVAHKLSRGGRGWGAITRVDCPSATPYPFKALIITFCFGCNTNYMLPSSFNHRLASRIPSPRFVSEGVRGQWSSLLRQAANKSTPTFYFFNVMITFVSQLNHCSGGFIHPQRHSGQGGLITRNTFSR